MLLANGGLSGLEIFELVYRSVILLVAGCGVIAFFWKGIGYFGFMNKLFRKLDVMSDKSNAFLDKMLPRIIQGLEKKEIAPENTMAEWTEIISSLTYSTKSPKYLNEYGNKLIKESSLKKIIDGNLDKFILDLE